MALGGYAPARLLVQSQCTDRSCGYDMVTAVLHDHGLRLTLYDESKIACQWQLFA